MSDKIEVKSEFDKWHDKWHDELNKIVNADTGETVKINDPIDTPIAVLSASENLEI